MKAYNVAQVPSLERFAAKAVKYDNADPIESCDAIVKAYPAPAPTIKVLTLRQGVMGDYGSGGKDIVRINPMRRFRSSARYYSTLFHELIHSTGRNNRLNRTELYNYRGRNKGIEEFVAEFGSSFLCAHAGILYHTQGKTAYYIKRMHDAYKVGDFVTILNAFAAAQRAADFVLNAPQAATVYQDRMNKYTYRRTLLLEMELEAQALLLLSLDLSGLGMPYVPASQSCNRLDTDTPDAMGADVAAALANLKARVGSVDLFVQEKLGYDTPAELCNALAAEQIDAVALAIDNVERLNQGIIIGDQTGIGKGRQAAAMIRYATMQGQTPVFFTEKPNLFTDLYRDLVAIGSPAIKPFIVNSREDKTAIRDENGNVAYQAPYKDEQDAAIKSRKLPNEYQMVMLTYSQMNSGHKIHKHSGEIIELSDKAAFVKDMAKDSLIILDEAHNASGESQTGKVLADIMSGVAGVVYLSATFAKRPDNMFIYAMRTSMQEASLSRDEYAGAFARGGVALQEVVAGQLVAQGQMIRRQRTFEGIEVNYITLDETASAYGMPDKQREHRAIGDEITRLIRRIIEFQTVFVTRAVKVLDNQAKDEQGEIEIASGTKQAGVDNTPYFSKVFNIVNQMLFAVKAESVAERAIQRLQEGLKPVIAFSSTMGSFVEELYEGGSVDGEDAVVNADFTNVLQRGLDGVLKITKKDGFGKTTTRLLKLDELPDGGQDEYHSIAQDIRESVSGLVLSPIDLIKQKITEAGYSVAEVTGRKLEMQLTRSEQPALVRKSSVGRMAIPEAVQRIMPKSQQKVVRNSDEFGEVLTRLDAVAAKLPGVGFTGDSKNGLLAKLKKDNAGDAALIDVMKRNSGLLSTVWLHYFSGGSDWYITEMDRPGIEDQQFYGYAVLNNDWLMAEWGYMSIEELTTTRGVELDFHWKPRTMLEIRQEHDEPVSALLVNEWPPIKMFLQKSGYYPSPGDGLGKLQRGAFKNYFETTQGQTEVYKLVGPNKAKRDSYQEASFTLSAGMILEVDEEILINGGEGVGYFAYTDSTGRTWYVSNEDVRFIPATPAIDPIYNKKTAPSGPGSGRLVGIIKTRKKENVSEAFRRFNDNEVDVLLINQSGSTGASAHAVPTKKVGKAQVKPRVMIVLQAELDINTEVQKRGRINRTGQLFKPKYDYITSGIPAEKRLMMMLKKKLKSLDANTTSNQRNSEDLMKSDDFLNKYGDKVVYSYLLENRDVNESLGKLVDENTEEHVGLAHKASGRVAVLPTDKQEEFYVAIIDSYEKLIRRLKERDEYDLEVDTLNLQAKSAGEKLLLVVGNGGSSAFGRSTYIEKLEVNNLRKPFKPEELAALIDSQLEGRSLDAYYNGLLDELALYEQGRIAQYRQFYDKKIAGEIEDYQESTKFKKMPRDQQAGALASYSDDVREGWLSRMRTNMDDLTRSIGQLREYFTYFQPGRMLQLEASQGTMVPCVVVGWSIDRKKKHPFDPKNVDCLIAVASSTKMMTLGMSESTDKLTLRAIQGVSISLARGWNAMRNYGNPTTYRDDMLNWWRFAIKAGVSDRTIRYMVTGNLLQAYKGDLMPGKGKIVTFSTFDGRQRRGIMLPDEYNPEGMATQAGGKVQVQLTDVPIQKAVKVIRALPVDKMIQTATGLSILRASPSTYKLICPQAKHKELYTDRMLLPLLMGEDGFNKVSNNMVAVFADADLDDVLMLLHTNHGMSVKLTKEQVSQITGEIEVDNEVDYLAPPPPAPLPPPEPEADDDLALLQLQLELEADALLLLLLDL